MVGKAMAAPGRDMGEQVEGLLDEVRRQGGEAASTSAEELVRLLVEYYGDGLVQIVGVVGEERPDLVLRLAEDPVVRSQLLLHGLHPLGPDERIEQALDAVRPYLGSHAGGVAYLGLDAAGVAHLRLDGSCHGCPSSTVTVRTTIEEAVLAAAPEVDAVEVEGQVEQPRQLLQIGRRPGEVPPARGDLDTAPTPMPVWLHPSSLQLPDDGQVRQVLLDGRPVLLSRLGETYYAYVDACPACGGSMAHGDLVGQVLSCPGCGSRYDVRLAGRSADGTGRHLNPLPLLDDVSGIRVALVREPV